MSAFSIKAEGGTHAADRPEIRRALSLLIAPGERHELRGLPGARSAVVGLGDPEADVESAVSLSDGQVYYSLNPIEPGAPRANKKTVMRRARIMVDVDPIRPADVSSTDEEKAAAGDLACKVTDYLLDRGWPAPLMVDSGNGWHLLYAVDLPNDNLSHQLVKAVLAHLAGVHDTNAAKVDTKTHDAPRIAKLPGTMARKGIATDERPHRMCRIAYEPESIELVTVDQLHALTAAEQPTNGHAGHSFKAAATETSKAGYVRSAVERECYRVALALAGSEGGEGRNMALNKAAFSLGQFASWPEMNEGEVKSLLQRAAERAGLDRDPGCGSRGILLTIASGWSAGKLEPRPRPVDARASKPTVAPNGPLTIRGSAVKPEKVDWLWENVIALNFMNLFAGRTGIGKSFILCDVAARLSRGLPMPDGTGGERTSNTLFISEDPYQYVLVPRLMELGADLDRIGFMRWEAMASYQLSDVSVLERAWEETDRPANIVIDPPSNFLGGRDEHKNAETRSVLMKLAEWIEKRPVAINLITHFNKGNAGKALDAIYRIMASVAWGSTSRVACGCEVDPDDTTRCIFGGIKNNLGPKAAVIGYRIERTESLAKITWLGTVDTTIDDAINKIKKKPRAVIAAEWLTERFRERRAWPSDDLYDLGRAAGVSRSALWEAAGTLPLKREVITPQDGGKRYWQWTARPDWPPIEIRETLETLETLGSNSNQDNEIGSVSSLDGGRDSSADRNASVSSVPSVSSVSGEDRRVINEMFKPF